jgi:outer membrane protein assembly factor BamB
MFTWISGDSPLSDARKHVSPPLEMIKTRDSILLGLDGEVRAYAANDGRQIWQADIHGAAHGMAVAGDQLFISTDRGHIYAFGVSR